MVAQGRTWVCIFKRVSPTTLDPDTTKRSSICFVGMLGC